MHIYAVSDIDTSFGSCFLADRSLLENLQISFSAVLRLPQLLQS